MSPRLETERLVLRPPKAKDQESFIAFYMSERAEMVGRETSRFAAWRCFAADAGHWALQGYGPWVVTLKGDDTAIGSVGAWQPAGFPERELGWVLWDGAEGYGFAFEAARASRDHDYRTFGTKTLVSYIDPENARSIRLAERLGARPDRQAEKAFPEDVVYRHTAPEGVQ